MIEHELHLIRKVVPHNLLGSTFIAGGAAIAPQSANDVDVWIVNPGMRSEELHTLQETLRDNLRKHGRPLEAYKGTLGGMLMSGLTVYSLNGPSEGECGGASSREECEMYRMAIESDWKDLGINLLLTYRPVADAGKQIQFLSVTAPGKSIMDLLERFDISSQVWATPVGESQSGLPYSVLLRSTLPSAMPRVVRWNTPQSTLTRLRKLCERYGWDIRIHPDVPKLTMLADASPNRYNGGLPSPATIGGTSDDIPF